MVAAAEELALLEQLPPLSRLALAYAPAAARGDWLTVLALDARLAAVLRQAREPMLAQLRLAWWRDRLGQPASERPTGEPLLGRLAAWSNEGAGFIPLVDGWEALLAEPPLAEEAISVFAEGRIALATSIASRLGCDAGNAAIRARRWALSDLAMHLGEPGERRTVLALAVASAPARGRCERALRPLAILEHLSARSGAASPFDLLAALRIGLLGV